MDLPLWNTPVIYGLVNNPCTGKVPSLMPTVATNLKVKTGVPMMN